MSREVDQRVVEMQFNNAQFERNTKQSLSTIEKLKAALKFDDVGDSFSGITKAAKNVNLEPVSDGANEVYYRFKALDVVAGTVLSNITAKAMTLGWTLTKALTIDPMKSGLAEYETQINSVQTILANTQKEGTNLAQVNAALDELNRYADMTIYNFTEMTRNIGTFTAAGVKLDTSVQAIKGIANVAAISGTNAEQASRAMYQLSQALASGKVRLMDWVSIETAGMGGQVFQDALKETARVHGVAIDEMIAKEGTFRETLQYGWLTASIMTETLAKFTGDLSEEELRAIGYTEEQIDAIIKMGETANNAATKVKTFTQLINTLKEAVQSGWTQSWEYIIGDFEEAKELWTEISNRLQTVISQSAEARNALLQGGLQSGLNQFIDQGITDYSDLLTDMLAKIGKASGAITDEEIESAGGLAKTLKSGWLNAEMLESSLLQVVKEASDLSKLSDEQLESMGLSREKVNDILKQFTELEEKVQDGTISIDEFIEKMNRPSGRENLIQSLFNVMDSFGKLMGTIKGAFDEVFPPMTAETLYKITESIRDLTSNLIISDDTADKLRRTFKGLFSIAKIGVNIITTLARAIGNTVRAIGNLGVIQGAAGQFLEITSAIGDFLSMVEEATRGITKIGGGFEAAASKVDSVKEAFVTIAEAIDSKFTIPEFETPIKTLTANFDSISKSIKDFGFSDKVVSSLEKLITLISTSGVSAFTVFSTAVGAAFYVIRDICINITEFIPKAVNAILELPKTASKAFKEFSDGVSEGANRVISMLEKVMEPFIKLRDIAIESLESTTSLDIYRILSLLDVGLLSVMVGQLAGSTKKLSDVFKDPVTKALDSIAGAFDSISGAVKSWQRQNTIKSIQYVAVAMLALSGALYVMSKIDLVNMAAGLGAIVVMTATFVVAMSQFRKSLADISTGKLVGLATIMVSIAGGAVILANAISELINAIKPSGEEDLATNVLIFAAAVSGLTVLMVAVGKLASMMSGTKAGVILTASVMLISLSSTLKIMASAVSSLATINAGGLVSGLLTVLSLLSMLTYVVGKVDFSGLGLFNGLALVGFATSLYIVANAIGKLAAIPSNLAAGVASVAAVITGMSAVSIAMQGLKFTSGAAMIAMATSILILYQAIKQYSKLKFSEFASGGYKVAAALTALTVTAIALSRNEGGVLAASVGLIAMSAALTVIAGVIERFASINFLSAIQGLVVFGATLGGLVIALTSLTALGPGLTVAASALGKVSLSMMGIAAAFMMFGTLDFGTIVGGTLAVVAVLGALIGVGAVVGNIPTIAAGLVALSTALSGLAKVFLSFAAAAASLALASAALGVLAMFAGPISQAIVGAAPDIGEALIALITMLCNVIAQMIDPILDTLGVVLVSVGEHLAAGIAGLWSYVGPAIESLIDQAKQFWWDHTFGHDWFGIGAMISDMGAVWRGDAEAAGEYVAQGYAKAFDEDETAADAIESFGAKLLYTFRRLFDIASPSKVTEQDGEYVDEGYALGIQNGTPGVEAAASTMANSAANAINTGDLAAKEAGAGISEAAAEGISEGAENANTAATDMAEGINNALLDSGLLENAYHFGVLIPQQIQAGMEAATKYMQLKDNPLVDQDALKEDTRNQILLGGKGKTSDGDALSDVLGGAGDAITGFWDSLGLGDTGLVSDAAKKAADEYSSAVDSALSSSSSGSSTKKTPAELVEDKYKEQLDANKTLQEIADAEYELWMTENQNGADANEILAKKLEHTQSEIATQTSRVEIAQAKYDDMVKAVGADAEEAKEAYAALLEEKNTLAKLQADRYSDLYEEVLNRLSLESDRISAEYELWTESNPGASDAEKTSRKVENITDQLANSADQLAYAEKQYQTLFEQYGESDLRVMEAKNDLLEAQLDYQKKNNELWEAQLEEFDNMMNVIDRESQYFQSRTDMLAKIYDDGDLSSRSEDYINAVETYGKNSPEAMRAKYQGSANGVLSVGVALRNMADQLRRTNVYQAKYNELVAEGSNATEEEIYQAQQNLLASQSAFLEFASDLADGFDMDEEAKSITMRLAYALSNNWSTVYGGFKKIWDQVAAKSPKLTQNLEKVFGDAFSEEGVEIGTGIVSTVTSALSGDTGGALASGLNTILSFLGSSMGQNLISTLGTAITNGLPEIGAILSSIFDGTILTAIGEGISTLVGTIGGGAGLAGVVETVGAALGSIGLAIPELLPIIAIIGAIIGAIALLISNWDEIGEFFNNLVQGFIDVGKNIVNGFIEGIKSAWNAFTDFIGGLFGGVVDFVKGIFGINSPSTEFIKIGSYIDEGFAKGIRDSASAVTSSMDDMTSSAMDSALRVSEMMHDTLANTDGFATEITPVVDFSTPKDTSNWYSSSVAGYGKDDAWGSRSSALASEVTVQKNQNGKSDNDSSRSDVVAAIDSLADRVVMMGQSIENMQIVLDSKKLVGGISGQMDSALGVRAARARRGG